MKKTFRPLTVNQPVFTIRADDPLSIPILMFYASQYGTGDTNSDEKEFADGVQAAISRFRNWQEQFSLLVERHYDIEDLTSIMDSTSDSFIPIDTFKKTNDALDKEIDLRKSLSIVNQHNASEILRLSIEIEKRDNQLIDAENEMKRLRMEMVKALDNDSTEQKQSIIKWSGSKSRIESNPNKAYSLVVELHKVRSKGKGNKPGKISSESFRYIVYFNGKIVSPESKLSTYSKQAEAQKAAEGYFLTHSNK